MQPESVERGSVERVPVERGLVEREPTVPVLIAPAAAEARAARRTVGMRLRTVPAARQVAAAARSSMAIRQTKTALKAWTIPTQRPIPKRGAARSETAGAPGPIEPGPIEPVLIVPGLIVLKSVVATAPEPGSIVAVAPVASLPWVEPVVPVELSAAGLATMLERLPWRRLWAAAAAFADRRAVALAAAVVGPCRAD
ncbi:hypothetical protein [Hwanghaeella sp.]|uniref:hypothetical protein n=1 Tax=Hwanghaeella sp. TaxID=2605943 RepID=UPI003CCC07CA